MFYVQIQWLRIHADLPYSYILLSPAGHCVSFVAICNSATFNVQFVYLKCQCPVCLFAMLNEPNVYMHSAMCVFAMLMSRVCICNVNVPCVYLQC